MTRRLSLWGPVLAWAGLIFFLSSLPDLSSGLEMDFVLRKTAHMVEYAVLAALLWRGLRGEGVHAVRPLFAASFLLSVLYAVSDEWHQSFVPGRGPAAWDVAVDAAGALAAAALLAWRSR